MTCAGSPRRRLDAVGLIREMVREINRKMMGVFVCFTWSGVDGDVDLG